MILCRGVKEENFDDHAVNYLIEIRIEMQYLGVRSLPFSDKEVDR